MLSKLFSKWIKRVAYLRFFQSKYVEPFAFNFANIIHKVMQFKVFQFCPLATCFAAFLHYQKFIWKCSKCSWINQCFNQSVIQLASIFEKRQDKPFPVENQFIKVPFQFSHFPRVRLLRWCSKYLIVSIIYFHPEFSSFPWIWARAARISGKPIETQFKE